MTVLETFFVRKCDQLVVVNAAGSPIGVLHLSHLLPYVFSEEIVQDSLINLISGDRLLPKYLSHSPFQTAATSKLSLQPITPIPAYWSLADLQPYLSTITQQTWMLVDSAGQYIGLLDDVSLLYFLATQTTASTQSLPQSLSVSQSKSILHTHVFGSALTLIKQLIERLPFPAMLQTSSGQVVIQNSVWQRQIEELRDPNALRQKAAELLEIDFADRETLQPVLSQEVSVSHSGKAAVDHLRWLNRQQNFVDHIATAVERSPISCRLSADAEMCICVCPTKNGQERTWQLLPISLGLGFSALCEGRSPSGESVQTSQTRASTRFQLATLEISPEIWQGASLDQLSSLQQEELWLILAQDRTEQQKVATELAAKNADLIQLNRLKDEFLACISHELKTPLTAVLGLSRLLKDQQLGALNERQTRYAELIHQSGRHLALIVNDILDLTRIETKQLDLLPELVKLEKICQQAYEQAKQLLTTEENLDFKPEEARLIFNKQFELKIQPGIDGIIADELRLRQMLANLLSNAIKFTEIGGKIGLNVEAWEGWIAFTVWDTGIGIPADKQHLIFQKFQQLENPLTRQFEGTGLGLVLTQRLAQLHGGDITFTSVEGQGSKFTLLLPPSPPQMALMQEADQIPKVFAPSSDRLAMVVESTSSNLDSLIHQLTEAGYRVAIARSGTEALEKIRRLRPTIVFLNPLLPSLSGWDVLILLKSEEETRSIPVIITATHAEQDQAYSCGAEGFLSLPITTKALQHVLDQLVGQIDRTIAKDSLNSLTVLHLHISEVADAVELGLNSFKVDLNSLLHPHNCRVVEVDDLDQADLLARVWKPDVMLLDLAVVNPLLYMKQFEQYPFLMSLPIVTLTPKVTQAANQVKGLSVFPYLEPILPHSKAESGDISPPALLQVLHLATGISWDPHVLIVDSAMIQTDLPPSTPTYATRMSSAASSMQQSEQWLNAFGQYVQTAGFHSSIGRSWADVMFMMRSQNVDLILICLRQTVHHASLVEALKTILSLGSKPPILLWDCQNSQSTDETDQSATVLLKAIATKILPASLTMQDLLNEIRQILISQ